MKAEYENIVRMYEVNEAALIDAKLQWANLDLENDELCVSLRKKNEQIKMFQNKITKLEIQLVKARDEIVKSGSQLSFEE